MNSICIRSLLTSVIIMLLALAVGCERHSAAWQRMDAAEAMMNEYPDSALVILESIDRSSPGGKEERARYALLSSMALDKNYIDTTTFDVLQPAIDYYLKKGTPDEKLKTLYYQGCIFLNRQDQDNAMERFLEAGEYVTTAKDTMAIANLLVAQGEIFLDTYKFDEFINYNLIAQELFNNIHKFSHRAKCLAKAFSGCMMSENEERADSIYTIITEFISEHPEFEEELLSYKFSYLNTFKGPDEIRKALAGFEPSDDIGDSFKLILADSYCEIGENHKGLLFFESISDNPELKNSLKYNAIKSTVLEANGDLTGALSTYKDFMDSLANKHLEVFRHDLLFAQSRHELEMANLREVQKKDKIILFSVCGAIVLLILACLIYYRLRLRKAELIIKDKEKRELQTDLDKLKEESNSLRNLLSQNNELSVPVANALKERIELLNSMFASEITKDGRLSKNYDKLRERLMKDRETFMNSTRLAFKASHPEFIKELEDAGLSDWEINYSCLYALGLSGKEVGDFIGLPRHYHISSAIGQKLGIRENNTVFKSYIIEMLKRQ